MKQIKTLVLMQLRDKIDLSWTKTRKDRIHTIVNFLLKFLILTALYTAVLFACSLLKLVYFSYLPQIMTFVITLVMAMLLFSNTIAMAEKIKYGKYS